MPDYRIKDTTLTAIADAIRQKNESTDTYTPEGMADAILMLDIGIDIDLDVITAEAGDIVSGKVGLNKEGEPLAGALALTGDAAVANVRKGKTFYNTNPKSKLTGTMAELAARTYTPGTANQTIAANNFLTGVQTIKGDSNLKAANIKKGVKIFGITGTWEGYVAGATDFYYNGSNNKGVALNTATSVTVTFETLYITISSTSVGTSYYAVLKANSFAFMGYSKIQITFKVVTVSNTSGLTFQLLKDSASGTRIDSYNYGNNGVSAGSTYTVELSVADEQNTFVPYFKIMPNGKVIQITRIRVV